MKFNVLLVNKCLFQLPCSRKKSCSGRLQNNMTGNYWNQWDLCTYSSIPNGSQELTCLNSWLYFSCIGVYKCSYSKWPFQLLHYCVVKLWTDVFYCVLSNLLCCTTIVLTQRKLICRQCVTSQYGFMCQHPTLQISSYKFKGRTANISYKYFSFFSFQLSLRTCHSKSSFLLFKVCKSAKHTVNTSLTLSQ